MRERDLIEFASPAFGFVGEDERLVNSDTMRGFALADHIAAELRHHGFSVTCKVAEDWGWYCEVANEGWPLWYGVSADREGEDFVIQIHPDRPTIRKGLFRKIDVSQRVGALQDAIFTVLANTEPRSSDPAWQG